MEIAFKSILKILIAVTTYLLLSGLNAQSVFKDFIPNNHIIIDSIIGNLNNDEFPDALIIIDSIPLNQSFKYFSSRTLLILIGNSDKTFLVFAKNKKIVMENGSGGGIPDPYSGMAIKNGYFTIEHYGGSAWRWTHYITFKYNKELNNWYLHKIIDSTFHTSNPKNAEVKIQSTKDFGAIKFEDYEE